MNRIKNNLSALIFLIVAIILYIGAYLQWGRCPEIDCSENLIDNWLRTIKAGSLFLFLYSSILLFLPSYFFKNWLKYIFSWGFPLVVYLTYITTGSSSIPAYGKVDVVKFWGVFFGVVTILFIGFQYYRSRTLK